jgi:subtilisin family serine protease
MRKDYMLLPILLITAACEELCTLVDTGPSCSPGIATAEPLPLGQAPGGLLAAEVTTTTVVKEVIVEVNEQQKGGAVAVEQAQIPAAFVSMGEKCYIARLRSADTDAAAVRVKIEELGGQAKRVYSKHMSAIEFCIGSRDAVRTLASHEKVVSIDEDKVFTTSAVQLNIPNHMYLMQHYGNYVFNNYLYDNILFRIFRIKRLLRLLSSSYEYRYTGRGVTIYLLDTAVDATVSRIRNRSGRTQSCNLHGDLMVKLMAGTKNGFAKDASVEVLDVADCAGKTRLSDILHALEGIPRDSSPKVVVFGISGPYSKSLDSAVASLSGPGSIVVTAAGNNHDQGCYYSPGSSREVINVGSATKHAHVSSFSNYGGCVRLYALGEDVFEETSTKGTSLSAAIVAGAVAVFLERFPSSNASQAWSYLDRNSFNSIFSGITVFYIPGRHLSLSGLFDFSLPGFQGYIGLVHCLTLIFLAGLLIYYAVKYYRRHRRRKREEEEERLVFDVPADRF